MEQVLAFRPNRAQAAKAGTTNSLQLCTHSLDITRHVSKICTFELSVTGIKQKHEVQASESTAVFNRWRVGLAYVVPAFARKLQKRFRLKAVLSNSTPKNHVPVWVMTGLKKNPVKATARTGFEGVGGIRTHDGGFAIHCLSHLATTPLNMHTVVLNWGPSSS